MPIRFLLFAFLCAYAPAASAHAILMDSTPPLGGHAAPGSLAIMLRYNSLIDVKRSRLLLIGPGREEVRLPIVAGPGGDRITATATVRTGANLLRWQVLAIDGHITRGNVPFDVAKAAGAGR